MVFLAVLLSVLIILMICFLFFEINNMRKIEVLTTVMLITEAVWVSLKMKHLQNPDEYTEEYISEQFAIFKTICNQNILSKLKSITLWPNRRRWTKKYNFIYDERVIGKVISTNDGTHHVAYTQKQAEYINQFGNLLGKL